MLNRFLLMRRNTQERGRGTHTPFRSGLFRSNDDRVSDAHPLLNATHRVHHSTIVKPVTNALLQANCGALQNLWIDWTNW